MTSHNEYIEAFAITKEYDKPQKLSLPIDLVTSISEQFDIFPHGVPVETEMRTMTVQAFIIGTKSFWEKPLILAPKNDEED